MNSEGDSFGVASLLNRINMCNFLVATTISSVGKHSEAT